MEKSFKTHPDYNNVNTIKQLTNGYIATAFEFQNIPGGDVIRIWDSKLNLFRSYTITNEKIVSLENINMDTLAMGTRYGGIKLMYISTGVIFKVIDTGLLYGGCNCLKLINNGQYLACGGYYDLNIYNINTGSLVSALKGHSHYLNDLVLINNDFLASSSDDQTIRIWELNTYTTKFVLTGHSSFVRGLKLISSKILASASSDTTVKLWDVTNGKLIRTLTGHTNGVNIVDLFINQILVSADRYGDVKFWDFNTGQLLRTINTGLQIYSLIVWNPIQSNDYNFLQFIKTD